MQANSQHAALSSTQRIKSLQDGLGGIRDVLLDNTQAVYCAEYQKADRLMRRAQSSIAVTGETPRFAIEALGMCLIAGLAFTLAQQPDGFSAALPVVGALAIAAQRMLPLLQQIYHALRIGISNGLWKPVGSPTDAWVAGRCRPGRLGTGICTVVLP